MHCSIDSATGEVWIDSVNYRSDSSSVSPAYADHGRDEERVMAEAGFVGCSAGCPPDKLLRVDVFCRAHERLIPMSSAPILRRLLISLRILGAYGLVESSTIRNSPVPLFVLICGLGAILHGYSMYQDKLTWLPYIAWGPAVICALAAYYHKESYLGIVPFVYACVLVVVWIIAVLAETSAGSPQAIILIACWGVTMGIAVVLAWAAAWLLHNAALFPYSLPIEILFAGVGVMVAMFVLATIGGVVSRPIVIDSYVRPLLAERPIPRRVFLRRPAVEGAVIRQFKGNRRSVIILVTSTLGVVIGSGEVLINVVSLSGAYAAMGATRAINMIDRILILAARLLKVITAAIIRAIIAVMRAVYDGLIFGAMCILLPVTLVCASVTVNYFVAYFLLDYLTGVERLASALLAIGGEVVVLAMIGIAVWSVSDLKFSFAIPAYARTLRIAAPYLLLAATCGGWIMSLLHIFNIGTISPGWITLSATLLLTIGFMLSRFLQAA